MILADAYELIFAVIVKSRAHAVNKHIFDVVALGGFDLEFERFAARDIHRLGAYLSALGLNDVDLELIHKLAVIGVAVVAGIGIEPVADRPACGECGRRRNLNAASGSIQLVVSRPAAQMISFVVDKRQSHGSALVFKNADYAASLVAVKRRVTDLYGAVVKYLSTAGRAYAGVALDIKRGPFLDRKLAAAGYLMRIAGIESRVYDKFAAVEGKVICGGLLGRDGLDGQAFL